MTLAEKRFGVWLRRARVGTLNQRGDFTWFVLAPTYAQDPHREVLGLVFEDDLTASHSSHMQLPAWFSNLLPEGRLRDWIAADKGVSIQREMELLSHVGHDLPGAVRVLAEEDPPDDFEEAEQQDREVKGPAEPSGRWRFSLAGVGLKFSMVAEGDRLTLPASGEGGDWIVKLPDSQFSDVPLNEHAMMSLAAASGLDVPEHRLVRRMDLPSLPDDAWQSAEEYAYAVRRFDSAIGSRDLIHIEDFAQIRNIHPHGDGKYQGSFETVGSLCYRGYDVRALEEFVRRVTFNILISNGDAHLKNWSLIYLDPRRPTLSPVYDLVSTAHYAIGPDEANHLGLKLGRSRRMNQQRVDVFGNLQEKLRVRGTDLEACAVETIDRVNQEWPHLAEELSSNSPLQNAVTESIQRATASLMGRANRSFP